jgi:hypothetical protein
MTRLGFDPSLTCHGLKKGQKHIQQGDVVQHPQQ